MGRKTAQRSVVFGLLLVALTGCGDGGSGAIPEPPAQGNVLDSANVLSDSEEQKLNSLIDGQNAGTDAARVAVLTVDGSAGSIEDFARDVATAWGVGDEGAENGVLVVADTGERELRIETADGVREQFSDDEAEDVVEDVLEPAFKDGEYAGGLTEAIDQIYLYAQGQEPPKDPYAWVLPVVIVGGLVVVVSLVVFWIVADSRRRRRLADEEIRAAENGDPDFELTDEQRDAYRKYRYSHRKPDSVSNPVMWLPLYLSNPSQFNGSTGSSSGSSVNGGGGFSGGGASGSY